MNFIRCSLPNRGLAGMGHAAMSVKHLKLTFDANSPFLKLNLKKKKLAHLFDITEREAEALRHVPGFFFHDAMTDMRPNLFHVWSFTKFDNFIFHQKEKNYALTFCFGKQFGSVHYSFLSEQERDRVFESLLKFGSRRK